MSDPNILPTHTAADEAMAALEPVFTSGRPDIVTMPSGRTVYASIGSDFIEIRSYDSPTPEVNGIFLASYTRRLGSTVMKASIVVKDGADRRNTDLHAARLLRRGLEYFDQANTSPVDTFCTEWVSDEGARYHSDNHETYIRALAADPESGPVAQASAARKTWTGKQMTALGFVWITSIKSEEDGSVSVTFKRPSVMSGPRSWINHLRSKWYEP